MVRARLSPSARVMVVDVVGAEMPNDTVSLSCRMVGRRMFREVTRAGWVSSGQVRGLTCDVIMMRGIVDGMWLTRASSSGVLPLKVIMITVSFGRIRPRSPCKASAGCRHAA